MFEDKGKIFIEDTDFCNSCTYFNQSVACPLLEALHADFVRLTEPDGGTVGQCGFYVKFERKMKVVKGSKDNGQGAEKHPSTQTPPKRGRARGRMEPVKPDSRGTEKPDEDC